MEEVRTAILSRRIAAAPANSAERSALEEKLTQTTQVRMFEVKMKHADRWFRLATKSDLGHDQHDRSSCFGSEPW